MRIARFAHTIVILHGASEKILCESMRANLRLPMHLISERGGSKPIQIDKLGDYFAKGAFSRRLDQLSKEQKIQLVDGIPMNTKVFTIMDTDDCKEHTLKRYKDGSLFSKSPFSKIITPIFNSPNLDSVMEEMGYLIDQRQKRKSYERIFPGENGDIVAAKKLRDNVSVLNSTNLNILLDHCIDEARKNSFNISNKSTGNKHNKK